jgi:hypothetical protein
MLSKVIWFSLFFCLLPLFLFFSPLFLFMNHCGRIVETFCRRARRGRIVEKWWKNCGKILWALERQRSKEELWKNRPGAKSFYKSSTILPRCAAERGPAKSFYNFSTIPPRWLFTLVRKQSFHGYFVEKL